MISAPAAEFEVDSPEYVDPVWEIRLRTWARRNYVADYERDAEWHPVILDEMDRVDAGH